MGLDKNKIIWCLDLPQLGPIHVIVIQIRERALLNQVKKVLKVLNSIYFYFFYSVKKID